MLLCVFFLVLSVPFATAVKQRICGIVGQAVFLNPGYLGDISKNETLWIFIHGNKNSVNILDYYPGRSTEYPNGQFNSRLQYNASSGGMRVLDLRPEDQGNFIFRVNGKDKSTVNLIVNSFIWADYLIVGAAIIGLVVSSISHVAWWILQKKQRNQVFQRLLHPLIICIFLTLVTTIIVLIFWIGIKGADFLVVVALTTISSWFLIRFACCVNLKLSCLFAQQQQKEGLQSLVGLDTTVVIPISLVILKKEIQQSGQGCYTSDLTWTITVSFLCCCVIIGCGCLPLCRSIRNNESNMADAERLGDNGALQS
ncbi:uncharacterized protein LOC132394485 isoform X3 [Hypanus sabinus]|uniref:uncharacterized protein LOC132394485 isoform X3 n=1 Tax=Hypanus sabinus TaxID=79690 RepID=UPI0028C3BDAF|nr:uncharacterized protein LOC132394485 isoform X3 [Hypanus sabinus]